MTNNRTRTTLGDLFRLKHGFAFKGEFFSSSGLYVLLTPGNFYAEGGLKLKGTKEKYYSGPVPEGFVLDRGDLLIAMTDLTQQAPILGSAAFVPEDGRYLHNQRLGKVTDVRDEVITPFLYYLLNDESVRAQIRSSASGATVKHTSPNRIYSVEVSIPSKQDQEAIVAVLRPYDELIKNNLRRIAILEDVARSLYREWFVELKLPRRDQRADDRWTDPRGWEETTLASAATIVMGQSPKSEFYNEEGRGLPFHQGVATYGARFPSTNRYTTVTSRIAEKDDVLFSVRAPVGRINVANERLVVGRGLAAIRSNVGRPWFLLQQLKERFTEEDQMGGGTIFKAVTKSDVYAIPFLLPPDALQEKFERAVAPIAALLENLYKQNGVMSTLRDTLLPKLISGEVEVSNLDIDTSWVAA